MTNAVCAAVQASLTRAVCDCDGNQNDVLPSHLRWLSDADSYDADIASVMMRDNCIDVSACNYDDSANGSCQVNDECGVCGGTGNPAGDCDCDGNQNDALGICGGSCEADVDADGICDDADNCTDVSACNYDDSANGSCQVNDECGVASVQAFLLVATDDDGNQNDALGICGGSRSRPTSMRMASAMVRMTDGVCSL